MQSTFVEKNSVLESTEAASTWFIMNKTFKGVLASKKCAFIMTNHKELSAAHFSEFKIFVSPMHNNGMSYVEF